MAPVVCGGYIAATNVGSLRDAFLISLGIIEPSPPEMPPAICERVIGKECPDDIILVDSPVTPDIDSVIEGILQEPYKLALAAREERTDWPNKESLDNGLLTMALVSFDESGQAQEFRIINIGVETGDITIVSVESPLQYGADAGIYQQFAEELIDNPVDSVVLVYGTTIDVAFDVVLPGGDTLFSTIEVSGNPMEQLTKVKTFFDQSIKAFEKAQNKKIIESFGISPEYLLLYLQNVFSSGELVQTMASLMKVAGTPESRRFLENMQKEKLVTKKVVAGN